MLVLKDGEAHIQVGAGIVADSDPPTEYQETLNKARGLLKAIEITESRLASRWLSRRPPGLDARMRSTAETPGSPSRER